MDRSSSNSSIMLTSTSQRGAGGGIGTNQRRRQSNATTANVDIEVPAAVMTGSGGIVDRTFQVGSPPSSSGGSMGSESEMMRRALIMGGIEGIADGLAMNMSDNENRSPEIGSAVSALGASSGGSSINGNKF